MSNQIQNADVKMFSKAMSCLISSKGMGKRLFFHFILMFSGALFLTGCVKLALKFSPSLIPSLTQTFFEECDAELARQSLPADLKLMEGLLRNDPNNKKLLTALCMGFTGYAMLFVEDEVPKRASPLYLRARAYGLKAIGLDEPLSMKDRRKTETFDVRLLALGKEEVEALFWATTAWNAWINLNLDKPAALGQLSNAKACLERILDIKPDYYYGAPYIMMGSILAARPAVLGGDHVKAREYFEKAMHMSHRKFFLAHYCFAKYYAVRVQDKQLFLKLIKEVDSTSPDELNEACLINTVMKEKTRSLKYVMEELFI
jgi:tetratricopeptide (TPR) repeat protein